MRVAVALVMMAAAVADADSGALMAPSSLPQTVRTRLASDIEVARKNDPGSFVAVNAVREKIAQMDQQKRGRRAPVSLVLKPMGEKALWPLLEHAAFKSPARGDLPDSAWIAWRVGVLEALGMLREPKALPVFAAVLNDRSAEPEVIRAAAEAMGRLGSDEAAQLLVKAAADSWRSDQVLSAMGSCRRLLTAQALSTAAATVEDDERAVLLAKSLGEVGNSWAWKTPALSAHATEESAVRQVAAEALLKLFLRFDGRARQAASNALMIVDAPTTASLIDAASAEASPELAVALRELKRRYGQNPTR